ncbi:hypothetical protein [Tengunoibacter tsumagoiensis]
MMPQTPIRAFLYLGFMEMFSDSGLDAGCNPLFGLSAIRTHWMA